jgi:adenine/guanine phosphoribosyltransferase-like PRPP-binding protein
MLLSAALHRWWPSKNPPAIADLGYYMMLSTTRELPVIVRSGKVVIVQDVLDTHRVSGDLANALKRQGVEVLCVISFIRMVKDLEVTRITPVNYWWPSAIDGLPHHAMIEIRRPRKCAPPKDAVEDAQAYWIEPRTLHPFKYKTLRRDFKAGRDPHLDRRDEYLRLFDNSNEGCLLTAGHYIYGQRHYPVTIDIRRTLTGSVSEEIVRWLANICEGTKEQRRKWESEEGYLLTGDTTAVLMPLQSQIHYIWPRVENLLAQRGRRQPSWWLESTLFTGSGPYHILPEQLIDQINSKVLEAVQSQKGPDELIDKPLRILVLDDAIASAQTAKNILTTIIREVRKAFIKTIATLKIKSRKPDSYPKIIQWIRYFAVLNQMDNARHSFWHNIKAISNKNIQFVFEEYAPFLGVPIYDDKTCPACRDIRRHKHLTARAMQHGAEEVVQWTTRRLKELRPVAVDSPDFQRNPSITLNKPIEVLTTKSRPAVNISKFRFMHADTAIWRFYELMYLSYPPNDVLESLNDSFAAAKSNIEQIEEYERYRWTVFEWCLHNWSRIKANAAEAVFLKSALREVRRNTPLVERIMDGASAHYRDPYILDFVTQQIARLAELERQREEGRASSKSRKEELSRLDSALTIFFLNIPLDELKVTQLARPTGETLLTFLERMARSISSSGHSLLKNLYLTVIRPQRYADPVWALETLAESLFRGRDPEDAPAGNHELLPRLLSEVRGRHVRNEEKRRLLRGSLALFLGALEDIKHYYGWSFSEKTAKIEQLCIEVIDWLKLTPDDEEYTMLPKIYFVQPLMRYSTETWVHSWLT